MSRQSFFCVQQSKTILSLCVTIQSGSVNLKVNTHNLGSSKRYIIEASGTTPLFALFVFGIVAVSCGRQKVWSSVTSVTPTLCVWHKRCQWKYCKRLEILLMCPIYNAPPTTRLLGSPNSEFVSVNIFVADTKVCQMLVSDDAGVGFPAINFCRNPHLSKATNVCTYISWPTLDCSLHQSHYQQPLDPPYQAKEGSHVDAHILQSFQETWSWRPSWHYEWRLSASS